MVQHNQRVIKPTKITSSLIFFHLQIFPVLELNSLCKNVFLIYFGKFPVFSLSGKMDLQIPCFPCGVATLIISSCHICTAVFPF